MALVLTADLGNSRLKLRAWDQTRSVVVARATFDSNGDIARTTEAFVREHGPFRAAASSSVASREMESALLDACRAAGIATCHPAPDSGLAIDVAEPDRVGRDRLYAARGAIEHARDGEREFIVLDAGTALTVDAVTTRGDTGPIAPVLGGAVAPILGGATARFLGGAIAPGPTLLARSLAEHTARLPLVEPDARARALGRDTRSAVQAGVVVGFCGAVAELARSIAREASFVSPIAVVTGGAREFLEDALNASDFERVVVDDDLVHRGLFVALRAALER